MERPQNRGRYTNDTPLIKPHLFTRWDTQQLAYDSAVAKGRYLVYLMCASTRTDFWYWHADRNWRGLAALESPFQHHNLLEEYGWTMTQTWVPRRISELTVAGGDLGLRQCKYIDLAQEREGRDPYGAAFGETGGQYQLDIDPRNGAIFVFNSISPEQNNRARQERNRIYSNGNSPLEAVPVTPALQRCSDVLFLAYQRMAEWENQDIRKLRYVFRCSIINADTRAVLRQIMEAPNTPMRTLKGWRESPWISIWNEQAMALLATPNGHGVAWLLINHKQSLGVKIVRRIKVFLNSTRDEGVTVDMPWTMLLEIADWPFDIVWPYPL
ncbi:hypothetical protein K402DRAFT_463472 [Aulographum hederae CBS 113979]|uniref:Uncharacterized protein n=1 Tax=Aulographum hederae CBS 113979 TaxID=1176131 RepID=A0A6G1H0G5_9PEZI|nr:hypothetical protein K402DRAFT_463472 [Aulographum hederae CBS 113979]